MKGRPNSSATNAPCGIPAVATPAITSIPSNELEKGVCLAPYKGPGPPPFTGLHRYVILLYEQNGENVPDLTAFTKMKQRLKFNTEEFAKKNGLKLVGANFYISQNANNKSLWFVPYVLMIGIGIGITALIYTKFS